MSGIGFAYPGALALYAAVLVMALLMVYARRQRRMALARFAGAGIRVRGRGWKAALLLTAAGLLVLALARPRGAGTAMPAGGGRDIVFALDVSRSMLAPDLRPSRLERARQAIFDLLPSLADARIGLVAFAGDADVMCPLTTDVQFFRTALAKASPDSVAAPGTHLATSLREALADAFDDLGGRSRHLVLITDGEDHGRFTLEPARSAPRLGVDLIVAGVGDSEHGTRIPAGTQFVSWQGREVWSKLDAGKLRAMAAAARGSYIAVGTDGRRFDEIRDLLAKPSPQRAAEASLGSRELYRWPLGAAFLLLCVELLIPERRR